MPTESEDYKKGCQNVIMEVHKQHNMISKKDATNPPKRIQIDTPSKSQEKVDPPKEIPQKQDKTVKEVEKPQPSFKIENELPKVKVLFL